MTMQLSHTRLSGRDDDALTSIVKEDQLPIKVLNKYKLAFVTKLKDELEVFKQETNYEEIYVFRNLLNAFSFNKNSYFKTFSPSNEKINGIFSYSPDIVQN